MKATKFNAETKNTMANNKIAPTYNLKTSIIMLVSHTAIINGNSV